MGSRIAVAGIVALVALAPIIDAQEESTPDVVRLFSSERHLPDHVPVVELQLSGRTVRGRLMAESDDALRVEAPGAGTIGYSKESVQDVRRFTVPAHDYLEQVGDHYAERMWDSPDAPSLFARARRAYAEAHDRAPTPGAQERLEEKVARLEAEREAWQQEKLRRDELARAEAETEAARLGRELAERKLASLERVQQQLADQQQLMQRLTSELAQLSAEARGMSRDLALLARQMDYLEDEVEELAHLDRIFVTHHVFYDLRRAADRTSED